MIMDNTTCHLKQLRTAAGKSQDDVVKGANEFVALMFPLTVRLDRVTLSKAENRSIILIPSHVCAIAAFLDCDMHDIYPYLYPEEPAG